MTYKEAKIQIAKKHGFNNLVTGHKSSYFDEAAELYADSIRDEVLNNVGVITGKDAENFIKKHGQGFKSR
jgi:aromatic ring-cleaving dioxygenase